MNSSPVCVIAEAGVNHNGRLELAERLVDMAAQAGADVVKFQTFQPDRLVRKDAPKAEYQKETTGSDGTQHEMLEGLQLPPEAFDALAKRCRMRRIEFLSSPFDEESADLLESIGVSRYKIASGEITNLPLLRHVAGKRKPIILSTGMSELREIGSALETLRAGGASDLTLLHCVSDYPTDPSDANLAVMDTLRKEFGLPVGFSDHTKGIAIALAAVARGAVTIEKHVTLDHGLPGPDHRLSLEPQELRAMIQGIRDVERALGDGVKRLTRGEESTQQVARRSLVAAENLPAGTVLERRHLAAKRPAGGLSPMELDSLVGRRIRSPLSKDELLRRDLLE